MNLSKLSSGYRIMPSIFKNGGPLPNALLFARVLVETLSRKAASFGLIKYFVIVSSFNCRLMKMKDNEIPDFYFLPS